MHQSNVLNKQLFSDAFLRRFEKSSNIDEGITSFYRTIQDWMHSTDFTANDSIFQSFILRVFESLVFYHSCSEDSICKIIELYDDPRKKEAISLSLIIPLSESLDSTTKGKHYSEKLIRMLTAKGLRWGILTNGVLWRLYHSNRPNPYENYYEINLAEAITRKDVATILMFKSLFEVDCFIQTDDLSSLDHYLVQSEEEILRIESHLRSKMEQLLSKISLGFIEAEGKEDFSEMEKKTIYENSIYFLYRLIFVLYAESRGLLPIQNNQYYEKSLESLVIISKEYHQGNKILKKARLIWNTLQEVFDWISNGNPSLAIPAYNGRLFNNDEKPYLRNHHINDAYLSEVLFNLGFESNGDSIDYHDLSVRHLGGLYEDMLEYQLFIASDDMVVRRTEQIIKYIPISKAGQLKKNDVIIKKGNIYFSQTSEERKLSASYYTPEPIVQNIVENAIGKILNDKITPFWKKMENELELQSQAINEGERLRIRSYIDNEIIQFVNSQILSTHICDPAMGSGHFLVNVANYCTNIIIQLLNRTEWINNDIDSSPIVWRRRVIEKCLYGIDKNPLATELSKLSLWLISASGEKPLSFLDHHLKTRNSLLGASISDMKSLPGEKKSNDESQANWHWFTFNKKLLPKMLQAYQEINDSLVNVGENIEEAEATYRKWKKVRDGIRYIADAWISTHFGIEISKDQYLAWLNSVLHDEKVDKNDSIIQLAKNERFLHWEIEFPDIFFTFRGFDAIIGNPPYGIKDENTFLNSYKLDSKDSYGLFMKRGINLLKEDGIFSMVVSDTWRTLKSHWNLRRYILDNTKVRSLIKLNRHAFNGVDAFTIITELQKCSDKKKRENNNYFFFDFWQIHPDKQKKYFNKLMKATNFYNRDIPWEFDERKAGKYKTNQGIIETNFNIPIFDGDDGLFIFLNQKIPTSTIISNESTINVIEVVVNDKKVFVTSLEEVAIVRQGMQTGNNPDFIYKDPIAAGKLKIVIKEKILEKKDLLNLNDHEKLNGIDSVKCIVPYEKGGRSNIHLKKLSNYYFPTEYYIDWSVNAVTYYKSHGNKMPSKNLYFKEGITFSSTGLYAPTFRVNSCGVFSAKGPIIISTLFDYEIILGVLSSKFAKYLINTFLNNSIETQVGIMKKFPLVIIDGEVGRKIKNLVNEIINKQKEELNYEYWTNEQIEIEKIVYHLYGLNKRLIQEVENWYARRYPKLAINNIGEAVE